MLTLNGFKKEVAGHLKAGRTRHHLFLSAQLFALLRLVLTVPAAIRLPRVPSYSLPPPSKEKL